jgi:two-component system cell cycle sensor histidine kinase/response regulator CckA
LASQRSIAQVILGLQAVLIVSLAIVLATQSGPTPPAVLGLALAVGVLSLELARRSVVLAEARMQNADRARKLAEVTAREALADRERASRQEGPRLQLQRLESVSRLAGGVAHDFNNLLTVIGASASMAERAHASGNSPIDDLHEIHLAVGRASELTKHLLALARKQVLVKRQVDLSQLVSATELSLRRLLGGGPTLVCSLTSDPLPVLADAAQLEQVLINLIVNAREAAGNQGQIDLITRRCPLAANPDSDPDDLIAGDYACLEVRDSGTGMTEDAQDRLFEPFFSGKSPGRGAGLVLATSLGIVRQHDGDIRVESQPGKGTLMSVLLPMLNAAEVALGNSGVQPVAGKRRRVLVAEDEPQVRAIATRALSAGGFEVLQAANGALALAMLKEPDAAFDVLVTDVVMPELTGPELARAAHALDPSLELVFMSGFPEAMQRADIDEFRGASFLAKPFSPQKLVQTVHECVARRAPQAAAVATKR